MNKTLISFCAGLILALTGCHRSLINLEKERIDHMIQDQDFLYHCAPLDNVLKLTLDEAIELALKKNLDIMVAWQQFEVQQEALFHQRWFMLPRLDLEALSSWRNKNTAATSKLVNFPDIPQPYSISVDQRTKTSALTLSWNLLDFGVAYYRSRQEANSALVKFFQYERTKQNIILEVTRQFWRVAALQKGFKDAADWLVHVDEIVAKLDKYARDGRMSPIKVATFNSSVLDNKVRIEVFKPELLRATAELQNLLGIPLEVEVELVGVDFTPEKIDLPPIAELEELALLNRPELYGNDLEGHSIADSVRIALLEVFPEIIPFIRHDYDANSFLLHHKWYTVGIRLATNLLGIPEKLQLARQGQAQKLQNKYQRLQLSLAVLSQVHLAYTLYQEQLEFYRTYEQVLRNLEFVRKAAERMRELDAKGEMDIIQAQAFAYQEQINALNTYAQLAASIEQLNNSMGLPGYLGSRSKQTNIEECEED